MSIKIGITGGIGSGKSVVSRLFELMGVPVYISDKESKRITTSDPFIRKELVALLGKEIYRGEKLNKSLLASYTFESPDQTKTINNIIHPHVQKDFQRWAAERSCYSILAMESAILIESGFVYETDITVMVYAPIKQRLERAVKRDASLREHVLKRMQSQMSDEEKKKLANYVILNDGEASLISQVESILKEQLCPNLL
ncbi:MAG: dephospho-CoA kinase [Mediterranea sp.]|jgi:dephospho-CoA kinase|nr:dephospho-CoA kinase [Mediterranea sp.]